MNQNQNASESGSGRVRYHGQAKDAFASARLDPPTDIPDEPYDVAIVGAGVVGCALAYELSQYRLKVLLLDKNYDVGEGTSKGNSAIIHTGFDAVPGSKESEMVTSASALWPALAEKLKVPLQRTGALLLAINEEQAKQLPKLHEKSLANGVEDVTFVGRDQVHALEPHASRHALGGLLVPRESIIDPFGVVVAYAEVALANGADIFLGTQVTDISTDQQGIHTLHTAAASSEKEQTEPVQLRCRWIVAAAGLWGRTLADRYGGAPFTTNPRRGQFLIYDRCARKLVHRILLPIPTAHTKGMLVSPTIFGNVLAGPTAEDLPADQTEATQTTVEGLQAIRENAYRLCPALEEQPVIASYAGLRCACAEGSYLIRYNDGRPGLVTLTGMRSTGLTGSIALAKSVAKGLSDECGLPLVRNSEATDERPASAWPGWWKPPFRDSARVAACPDYGDIVCYCEAISRGELSDALKSPLRPATLDALKRRTRAQMGRCQAFNCGVTIARMIAEHTGTPLDQVSKKGLGSEWITPSSSE